MTVSPASIYHGVLPPYVYWCTPPSERQTTNNKEMTDHWQCLVHRHFRVGVEVHVHCAQICGGQQPSRETSPERMLSIEEP